VAGTEVGVTEPQATFSPCFGGPFLVWRPAKYAQLLSDKITKHGANVWLVNTGWSGGPYGVGKRMPLAVTRAIIDGIHAGALREAPILRDPVFGLDMVTQCPGAPKEILVPRDAWQDGASFDQAAHKLAQRFQANFKGHEGAVDREVREAGPAS
jgi:phosphoenolpyruvate carboxykinase (ATP)